MEPSYCERWDFLDVHPVKPLTTEQARARDQKGKLYTAIIGDPTNPKTLVEVVRPDYIGVYFPDHLGRQWQKFTFQCVNDRMFLESVIRWQYGDDNARMLGESELIENIRFHEDGTVHRQVRDKRRGRR